MTKKYIAQEFLKLAANGHSHEAFRLYVGKNFKHHNAYFKGDAETLMLAMDESSRKNPYKTFKIHHALRDGDMVAVHSHVKQNSTDLGAAVVHLFKFESDKIVELWDLGQTIPKDIKNENGMF
ncbi:putative SnoaL-like aldol condensation-catalyzing enzyme [Flavobacterium sp. 90]|uniref:nuclear transport factor 2 family protein n=1 Tax=unclassified Flavobacterium TaxID=196869 RepID=UPI000EB27AC2|nr:MULTISPECIES: nuclear transport factor 2 family protein [unclassified Flavobacterium]RKR11748.1 putative SnoaL-like aldol condensation-catalyzing enzyme [Flavobacterium sp. 81]TCK55524.1 putative SnoaL-like aldol condensation-catalyzing enzyme [Flavobacterium sp. 90]